jgi:thymidylate kinase
MLGLWWTQLVGSNGWGGVDVIIKAMLILIRGNSGSGKSTVARLLRDKFLDNGFEKVALVEQDHLRRIVLKEKDKKGGDNIGLIEQTVRYALSMGYITILEGILYSGHYAPMLKRLVDSADSTKVYYFDIPLEETLRRHKTKPNSHEFGEKELRAWYSQRDYLHVKDEQIISEQLSCNDIVEKLFLEAKSGILNT